jgi:hypothetical protein
VLAETGAPAFVGKYATARATAPVIPFVAAVLGIIGPKAIAAARAHQERKKAAGGLEPAPVIELVKPDGRPVRNAYGGPVE